MSNNTPLTLDDRDPHVVAAQAAEQTLYDFYGIRHTVRYVVLPSHKIRVRITETGEGNPVVVVPGNTGDGFPFIPLLPHLLGHRVIIINRPGGGLSEGINYTTVDFHDFAIETLTTVFDALGLDRVPIVAHSMGGHSAESIDRQPAALAECYFRFPQLPHYLISTLSLMTSVNRLRGSIPRYRITAEQLRTITQPVLYLWGTDDPFGSVATGEKIAALVPNSDFQTLDGGGHLPWLDDPKYAGRLVCDFLDYL